MSPKKPKQYKPKKNKHAKQFKLHGSTRNAREMGYTKQWEKYRYRFLHHNPKCYVCSMKSEHVDHIVAAKVDRDKYFWKVDNYMPMCRRCHGYVTGKFDRFEIPKTEEKLAWIKQRRLMFNINIKVKIVPFKGENVS